MSVPNLLIIASVICIITAVSVYVISEINYSRMKKNKLNIIRKFIDEVQRFDYGYKDNFIFKYLDFVLKNFYFVKFKIFPNIPIEILDKVHTILVHLRTLSQVNTEALEKYVPKLKIVFNTLELLNDDHLSLLDEKVIQDLNETLDSKLLKPIQNEIEILKQDIIVDLKHNLQKED